MLTRREQQALLAIARSAFEARVLGRPPAATPIVAERHQPGAFVTILSGGALRGCLGRVVTDLSLPDLIGQLGQAVADSDPRFDPVNPDELHRITMEISVLSPEREIRSVAEIEVGRHGLIVEQGSRRGLLLPQVAVENEWDRETFASHTCLKAGLAGDAWRHGATLHVFEAHVFGEHEADESGVRD